MKLIQVAGYSNSGKTTLIEKLVARLKDQRKKVSVIKHHGHKNRLFALDTGKDSARFREAGAAGTTVVAGNKLQVHFENEANWSLADALKFQQFFNTDIVIIEGFKKEPFPKVVIVRREEDLQLLDRLENIHVILFWEKIILPLELNVPHFYINDFDLFFDWLMNNILEEKNE